MLLMVLCTGISNFMNVACIQATMNAFSNKSVQLF